MALSCNPKLLIADEPTTALDVTIQAEILDLLRELKEDFHLSMLLITHDLGVVAETADRVAVMYAGRIVEQANVHEIFHNPRHPYTEGLLRSVPKLTKEGLKVKRLETIEGTVPSLLALPAGCKFAPRCSYVIANARWLSLSCSLSMTSTARAAYGLSRSETNRPRLTLSVRAASRSTSAWLSLIESVPPAVAGG